MQCNTALNFGQRIITNIVRRGNKTSAVKSASSLFHGINPSLTYPATGKTFYLPRFCTREMKQARALNKIAIQQVKNPVAHTFSKATPKDLKRLTSETMEDTYSRVQWTNPKDGKVYNLLKHGETETGNVIIRILDKDGAFIKEAEIKPKTITIVDGFDIVDSHIPHGKLVETYARRNNPFAKFQIKKVNMLNSKTPDHIQLNETLRNISDTTDYLSISIANVKSCPQKVPYERLKPEIEKFNNTPEQALTKEYIEILNKHSSKGTRVITGAGNDGVGKINVNAGGQIEMVGALAPDGRVANFSSSRNSGLTQHYELGVFTPKEVHINSELAGYNITGTTGVDIPLKDVQEVFTQTKSNLKNLYLKRDNIQIQKQEIKAKIDALEKTINEEIFKTKDSNQDFFAIVDSVRNKYKAELTSLEETNTKLFFEVSEINNQIKNLENLPTNNILPATLWGTSFSTPIRTAKLALNDMLEGVL